MTMRPQNHCKHCGYTWYPRGKNLSNKCPNCGSRAVQISPISAAAVGIGGAMLLFCLICGGVGSLFRDKSRDDAQPPVARNKHTEKTDNEKQRPDAPDFEPRERPSSSPTPSGRKGPVREKEPAGELEPVGKAGPVAKKEAPSPEPVDLEEAPLPRPVVALNHVPVGFTSAWVHRAGVQTRLLGASVTQPVLIDAVGKEFTSPDSLLVVWVETRSLTASNITLRPWLSPGAEFASIKEDKTAAPVRAKRFTNGTRVGGRIEGAVKLVAEGPSVVDVLVFDHPKSECDLRLTLQGSHVGHRDVSFGHTIPVEVWAKK